MFKQAQEQPVQQTQPNWAERHFPETSRWVNDVREYSKTSPIEKFRGGEEKAWGDLVSNAGRYGLIGAGIGGLGLGAARWLMSPKDEDPKVRRAGIVRQALLGAVLGGAAGVTGSGAKYLMRDKSMPDSTAAKFLGKPVGRWLWHNKAMTVGAAAGPVTELVNGRGPFKPLTRRLQERAVELADASPDLSRGYIALAQRLTQIRHDPASLSHVPPMGKTMPDILSGLAPAGTTQPPQATMLFPRQLMPQGSRLSASPKEEGRWLRPLARQGAFDTPIARFRGGIGGTAALSVGGALLGTAADSTMNHWFYNTPQPQLRGNDNISMKQQ